MPPISYARHQFPPEVIQHAVWLYLRFTLSHRDVEDLLAERGLEASYETVRRWVLKFGPAIALLQRSPAWAASGRVRPGRAPSTMQGHPSCRSKRMPLGAITSRSRSTG